MSTKRFITLLILLPLIGLLCCAGIIYVIDPAMQYHEPFFGISQVYNDERSQNAGLAKNADYDSVVLGSSVTSNFRVSWFDEQFGCKAVKLCYPGGTFSDYDAALETAFRTHDIKTVFWCVDPQLLVASPVNPTPLPDYLYDDSILNDYQYLLNKDVLLKQCAPAVLATLRGEQPDYDEAFVWDHGYTYSVIKATESYDRPAQSAVQYPADHYDAVAAENWAILDKWIEAHPETTFYLYYPPYSSLYLDQQLRLGMREPTWKMLGGTLERYIACENVRFYNFLVDPVTIDYNNYTDMVHYQSSVNRHMVEYMAANEPYDLAKVDWFLNAFTYRADNYKFDTLFTDYKSPDGE